MMQKPLFLTSLGLMIIFGLSVVSHVKAQVRESANYQIQSDSINVGGGLGDSANYSLESTVGEVATGQSDSANYNLRAGYQQMQEVYLALSGADNIIMSPSIPGLTGGESAGSTTVTVTTDSTAGYQLTIESSANPAMQSITDSIPDYVPAGADPDYTFNYGAGDAFFGYSPKGIDVVDRFLDNGLDTCGVGNSNTLGTCWDGLSSTTPEAIAIGVGPNHPNGATTTINFKVGVGGAVGQALGIYRATSTITALPL
jgi:hypothetical protein